MADGCLGLQFYIDTGRMEVALLLNRETRITRETIVFPKLRIGYKDVRKPRDAKYILVPNFCPACGMPYIVDGEHQNEPSCTGRLEEAKS